MTLINVNNYIKVPAPSQVLPVSDLETVDFVFLESFLLFTKEAETKSTALNSNPFVLKLPLLKGLADSLRESLSAQLAS